ncbi:MAG: DUF4445 domain-containing protein [Kiritimatiellae bacterium]|nr:DUF4445 domain-containing protein [Kiritimatiellia bacterium]
MKSREEVKVTFQPSGRSVYVLPGTILLEAAARAGLILQTPCGGRGTCGKCRVRVVSGACTLGSETRQALGADAEDGYRLACQEKVQGGVVVEVPEESLFEHAQQILVSDTGERAKLDPVVRKTCFELPEPDQANPESDRARLRRATGAAKVSFELLREVPGFMRRNGWRGTAVLMPERLLALEPGDTTASLYGAAFDIGTTTIVGTLIDLVAGRERAVVSRLNPQIARGDDVLARILWIREQADGLAELQQAVIACVNEILAELAAEAGVDRRDVYEVVVAGNSTMQQILCGYDPSALGELPFVPVFDEGRRTSARSVGIEANAAAELYVFPQIGGFIGGDTVAGMVAARLNKWHTWKAPVLLVDIGTNGEIVLAHDGRMLATSTAAGPAFEGARIAQGMRATSGAIEKVVIVDGELRLNVIGNVPPVGLCGTALIDAAAWLLRTGLLEPTGRIVSAAEAPAGTPEPLRERLVEREDRTDFLLAAAEESGNGEPVLLRQKDIRELQLAAGAIRAGVNILLRRAGLDAGQLGAVLLAGAFGNFIRRRNAQRIGLLPAIAHDHVRFIGNAASLGAKMALLCATERDYAEELRRQTEHVDLSLDPEFQAEFGAAMLFPDGDVG